MYRELDLNTWKRKSAFDYFSIFDDPFFNITANVDVSKLYQLCKQKGYSFNLSILYYSQLVVNEIEEFKIRILDDRLVIYDVVQCGNTVLHEDETFSFCYFTLADSLEEFVVEGKKRIAAQVAEKTLDPKLNQLDMIHYSVIPWVSFTSFKHAKRLDKSDSIPKIVFGRYLKQGDTYLMPISVALNHRLADGVHTGKYFTKLQDKLDQL